MVPVWALAEELMCFPSSAKLELPDPEKFSQALPTTHPPEKNASDPLEVKDPDTLITFLSGQRDGTTSQDLHEEKYFNLYFTKCCKLYSGSFSCSVIAEQSYTEILTLFTAGQHSPSSLTFCWA